MAILEALALGARNMIMTGILLNSVGLIVDVIATTGIGTTFSLMIPQWASGSLRVTILLIALASFLLSWPFSLLCPGQFWCMLLLQSCSWLLLMTILNNSHEPTMFFRKLQRHEP